MLSDHFDIEITIKILKNHFFFRIWCLEHLLRGFLLLKNYQNSRFWLFEKINFPQGISRIFLHTTFFANPPHCATAEFDKYLNFELRKLFFYSIPNYLTKLFFLDDITYSRLEVERTQKYVQDFE